MKIKTKIEKQLKRKINPELVETIIKAKKHLGWVGIAKILSSPRKNKVQVNLEKIEKQTKEGDVIVIPGKVLGEGEISKKIKIVAIDFSDKARKKLKNKNCEIMSILGEINKNPKAQEIKVLK